jgi:hypothetical protein
MLSLLWVFVSCVSIVFAKASITLYHQLVHSESARDITPRGVITYDPTTNDVSYSAQGEVIDLAAARGIYRVGMYDVTKKALGPAAFAKLVLTLPLILISGIGGRTSNRRNHSLCVLG